MSQLKRSIFNPVILKGAQVTSKYGVKRFVTLSDGTLYTDIHSGVDIVGDDDNLLAIDSGVVYFLTENDGTGSKTIVLKHKYNNKYLLVLYAHCAGFSVKVGDLVDKGQKVADVGATGRVSAKHCHVSMYEVDDDYIFNYSTRAKYQIDPNEILKLY